MPVTRRLGERALNVGVPAALYESAQRIAAEQAQSLAAVTRRALTEFIQRYGQDAEERSSSRRASTARKR